MESTIEATGNKVDDLSYVHGFGMAQGLTQQGFSFINMELLGNFFNEFANKTKELVEPQAADTALRMNSLLLFLSYSQVYFTKLNFSTLHLKILM